MSIKSNADFRRFFGCEVSLIADSGQKKKYKRIFKFTTPMGNDNQVREWQS